jgi:hypothetical protein
VASILSQSSINVTKQQAQKKRNKEEKKKRRKKWSNKWKNPPKEAHLHPYTFHNTFT